MNWLLEPFELINGERALLAAVVIGFTNGYLSTYVVLRKSALKVGALSNSLFPGIAVAVLIAGLTQTGAFLGAVGAALVTGLGSLLVARSSRLDHDTSLAVLFTSAFALGIVLMRYLDIPSELDQWLLGNILGMSDADLWIVYGISGAALLFLTMFQRPIIVLLFEPDVAASLGIPVRRYSYIMFGLVILVLVSSIQAIGTVLSLALLTTPAATIYMLCDSPRLVFWGGAFLGAGASMISLVACYWMDVPAGAMIVVVLGFLFLVSYLFSPKYGLVRWFASRRKG